MISKYPPAVREIGRVFHRNGYSCFLVGGAVRDRLLQRGGTDFDLATNATPDEVLKLFRRVIPTGIQHGTVTVIYRGYHFEVTTFRSEQAYSDNRHPDGVRFIPSIEEDLKRRDFTINSIALDLHTGEVLDPHDGRQDLEHKLVKAIGNPIERFTEDHLRILRGIRFMTQLEFSIAPETLRGMKECSGGISGTSIERIRDELIKVLLSRVPSTGLIVMEELGILPTIIPELSACRGISQGDRHKFDLFHHSIYAADGASKQSLEIPLAALLHDLGKATTRKVEPLGKITFYNHDKESARLARIIMERLKFPKIITNNVCHLILHHMFNYQERWSDSAVRRFLKRISPEMVEPLFQLRRADSYALQGVSPPLLQLDSFRKRIAEVIERGEALTLRELKITGNELHSEARIPKGPDMGKVLEFLMEAVIDDPALNTREDLLEIASRFYKERLADVPRGTKPT